MKLVQHRTLRALMLAAACIICPASAEAAVAWNLADVPKSFPNTSTAENHVCLVYDGWQIAFLSHNKEQIGAVFITEKSEDRPHQYPLDETIQRLVELTGLRSPEKLQLDQAAIIIDSELIQSLGDEAEHVFCGSPLEGMAYLLREEYFYINSIRPNGYLHWKTVKKSGVELLMPMAPSKLSALEVTGRQEMNEFASEVLARKLGLGSNTASPSQRAGARSQINCSEVTYMNSKRNIVGARQKKRFIIGKRNAVSYMLAHHNTGALLYPLKACDWPEKPQEPVAEEPPEPPRKPALPLTPAEAREAYKKYLQGLAR